MHPILALGLSAIRRNALPGLALWVVGAAVLAGYFLVPALMPAFAAAAAWQHDGGMAASGVLTAIAGGLVPSLVLAGRGQLHGRGLAVHVVGAALFWFYRGVEVDLFYRLQSLWFGDGADPATLLKKVLVDQLLYTALWSIPTTFLFFFWFTDCRRRWSTFRAGLTGHTLGVRLPALVVSAWAVWIPMVCIINSVPPDLRVPVLALALVFWSLCVSASANPVSDDQDTDKKGLAARKASPAL